MGLLIVTDKGKFLEVCTLKEKKRFKKKKIKTKNGEKECASLTKLVAVLAVI